MSLDYKGIKNIYVVSTAVIITVVLLLAISAYKSQKKYEDSNLIAIKTSRGLIKMNAAALADNLSMIHADLARHEGYERTSKFDIEINEVLDHVKEFINKNPNTKSTSAEETKIRLHNKAFHANANHVKYNPYLSREDIDNTAETKLDHLLRHCDILINMLQLNMCDVGVLDITKLENIADTLDADLTKDSVVDFDREVEYIDPLEPGIGVRTKQLVRSRLPMFSSQVSQIEGLNVESQLRAINKEQFVQGPQNVRNVQQRSQMFRENNRKLGIKHYLDEDLLLTPTYDSMAL